MFYVFGLSQEKNSAVYRNSSIDELDTFRVMWLIKKKQGKV
jgi:hypothetical protein